MPPNQFLLSQKKDTQQEETDKQTWGLNLSGRFRGVVGDWCVELTENMQTRSVLWFWETSAARDTTNNPLII